MTLKETWSVATDQSRPGGSVPRLTRTTLSLATSEEGRHEMKRMTSESARAQRPAILSACGKGEGYLLRNSFSGY